MSIPEVRFVPRAPSAARLWRSRLGGSMLACVVLAFGCSHPAAKEEEHALVTVKVASAERRDVNITVTAPGTVFPRAQANITSTMTAPIRELPVRKGDAVAAGQVLVVLEGRDLAAQKSEIEAALHQAEAIYERRRQLFEQGAIPQRDLLVSETDLTQARARVARLDAQLQFTRIESPFAGHVTEQFLYPGDMVKPDTPVMTVVDLSTAIIRAQVPEAEAGSLRAGQIGTFRAVDAPDIELNGRLTMVNRSVDAARRTVEVWCEIPRPGDTLRVGAFGHLAILVRTLPAAVVVPRAAVQLAESGRAGSLVVIDAQSVAHTREIETGETIDGQIVVTRGLQGGERVVAEGSYGLPDGTAVRLDGEK